MFIHAQEEKGIRFEQELSWQQILNKAKAENKYIFVDAYATWCGPCKLMDNDVYPSEKVGEYLNKKFIAVKVQMDSSRNDTKRIKEWYVEAKRIFQEYQITAFPTYLFFSPEGKIVHRSAGAMSVNDFISLSRDAINPVRQYYSLLEMYKSNKLTDYEALNVLAASVMNMGNEDLAYEIARKYKIGYLDKLSIEKLKYEDFVFINQFYKLILNDGSKGKFFGLMYLNSEKVDNIAHWKGFSEHYIKAVITKEEIDSKILINNKPITNRPDWKTISENIKKRYNSRYAENVVEEGKIRFFRQIEDWNAYAELIDEKCKRYNPKPGDDIMGEAWKLNGVAWDVFLYCNVENVLKKAILWIDLSLKLQEANPNPQCMDTKACLLYKLGKVKEAVEWEEKTIRTIEESAKKNGRDPEKFTKEYKEVLKEMLKGQPIYISQGAIWLK